MLDDQNPLLRGEGTLQVGDRGEAFGVNGGETKCRTPDMKFVGHGEAGRWCEREGERNGGAQSRGGTSGWKVAAQLSRRVGG